MRIYQRRKKLKNTTKIKCEKINNKWGRGRYLGFGVRAANIRSEFSATSNFSCITSVSIFSIQYSAANELAMCADSIYIWAFKWMHWMDAVHFLLAYFIFFYATHPTLHGFCVLPNFFSCHAFIISTPQIVLVDPFGLAISTQTPTNVFVSFHIFFILLELWFHSLN